MFRPKRPISGRLVFLAAVTSLALSGLAGCAKKESEDAWRMTPPTFELLDSKEGKIQRLEYAKVKTGLEPFVANDSAVLRFALADAGLAMKVKSECENGTEKSGEYTATMTTAEVVSVFTLVPPTVLRPEALKKEWNCSLKAQVMNTNGSKHSFEVNNFKLNFSSVSQRLSAADVKQLSDDHDVRSRYARRVICPSWWTDVAPGDNLASVARTEKLNGRDTRDIERQPLCSVLELSAKAEIVRLYTPNFGAPNLSWTTKSLVTTQTLPKLLQQPLLAWQIRNDGSNAQIGFIALPVASLQISGLNEYANGRGWALPNPVRPVFTVEGAESRTTNQGFYFSIGAKSSVRLTMTSNITPSVCAYDAATTHIMIAAERQVRLQTLSNTDQIVSVANADPAKLDGSPRDKQDFGTSDLIPAIILKVDRGTGTFPISDVTIDQAKAMAPAQGEACFLATHIPPFDIMNPVTPPIVGR